jgi:predicted AAA+ superfamily ATPase
MWRRESQSRLRALWRQFPAVLILGARQVGKTTLARQTFPALPYCDLEEPHLRALFTDDPTFQIQQRSRPALIIDEAQVVPGVFNSLRGIIDAQHRKNGRFLLLGSAQPSLIRKISESLAGRVGILELDPLTAAEAATGDQARDWRHLWLQGGFPDALRGSFREWWEAYLRTYVERDLPQLGIPADSLLLRRLLTMVAHVQGGMLNASQLGNSLDVTYHTVQRYLDVLEQTFIIRRLRPFYRNIGKRLTKAPKIYLRDTGLLHHLLNINSLEELDQHPARGASWETFVMEDLLRKEKLRHPHTQFYYWRTAAGAELDLLLDRGSQRLGIEIKAGRGDKIRMARAAEQIAGDIGAASVWIIDQATGTEALRPSVHRRGFAESLHWLPGA